VSNPESTRDLGVVFPYRRCSSRPRVRLFCLPYAGGSALVYRSWQEAFGEDVDVCPVELRGRGSRIDEPPFSSMAPLVSELLEAAGPLLDAPIALFGHSMGAQIAFELAKGWGERVAMLFVSASPAPDVPRIDPIAHLDDGAFLREIAAKGGTRREILEDEELMSLVLPFLRADFNLIETYRASDAARVACPIVAFAGTMDYDVPAPAVSEWNRYTTGTFRCVEVPAAHFYLEQARDLLTREIAQSLAPVGR
jgi:surfactin synthase thioesterase subunit